VSAGSAELPTAFTVLAPFLNPANPSTNIPILLPRSGSLDVRLFDLLGREISVVLSGVLEAGPHTVTVDGSRLATGTYFCRIAFEGEAHTSRLLVLR
jgi:hypothetical protein